MADAWNPTETEISRDSSRACWPASLVELGSPRPQREMLSQNFTLRNDTWGWSLASTSMSTRTCTHTYTYTCSLPHTQYILHIHIWISHPYMSEVDECVYLSWERWRCKVSKDPNHLIEKGARNAQHTKYLPIPSVLLLTLCYTNSLLCRLTLLCIPSPVVSRDQKTLQFPSRKSAQTDLTPPQGESSRGTALKEHFLSVLCSSWLCPFRHSTCPQSSARFMWFPTPRSHFCE